MVKKVIKNIEETSLERKTPKVVANRSNSFSSGITRMNLVATGQPGLHYIKGLFYLNCGESSAGKTVLMMMAFAEAARNKNFNSYRLIFDNPEGGQLMDVEHWYGKKLADRLEAPTSSGSPSGTYEEFQANFWAAKKEGTPFIYGLDSMDALTSEQEEETIEKTVTAIQNGKETPGSFGDGKAKKNSSFLRNVCSYLQKSGSILLINSQVRDRLTGMGGKSRSGGNALRFYNRMEWWGTPTQMLRKTIKGRERIVGNGTKWTVKKNHITGLRDELELDYYLDYGFDDIGDCIDFLTSEKVWSLTKNTIDATDFEFAGTRQKLITHIEENNLYPLLQAKVGEVWRDIREACSMKRKPRYE